MSGRVYLLGVGLALVALALAVTHERLGPWPGVTEANVKRIKPGMTMREVEGILGGAGRERVTITEGGRDVSAFQWTGPGAVVYVLFDEPGPALRPGLDSSAAPRKVLTRSSEMRYNPPLLSSSCGKDQPSSVRHRRRRAADMPTAGVRAR